MEAASGNIVSILWQLMENNVEEVRLLQTSMLLLTTTNYVQSHTLSQGYKANLNLASKQDAGWLS